MSVCIYNPLLDDATQEHTIDHYYWSLQSFNVINKYK